MIGLGVNQVPPPQYGGIETVIANLSASLVRRGHRVSLYAPGVTTLEGVRHISTMPQPIMLREDGKLIINPPAHVNAIVSGLEKEYQPGDIIHLHHFSHASDLKGLTGTRANVCETAHWTTAGLNKNVFYPSKALMGKIGKPGCLVYHGIDTDHWTPDEANANQASTSRFFYAGRLTEDKGLDLAVRACLDAGTRLVVAGPYPDENNSFGRSVLQQIDYIGELAPEALRAEYRRASALLYLTQYCEPFGLAIVEAMACGCPAIVSGNGATSETVIHGRTGFVVRSPADLAKAMNAVGTISRAESVSRAAAFDLAQQVFAQEAAYMEFFGDQPEGSGRGNE